MADLTEEQKKTFVTEGVAAIFEKGWRKGYFSGKKDAHDEAKYLVPVLTIILALFFATIGGGILYGVAARQGWADIIGVCLQ